MYAVIAQPPRDFLNLGSKTDTLFSQATPKLFCSKLLSRNRSSNFKHMLTTNNGVGSKDGFISLKCKSCSRVRAPIILSTKRKVLKFSAFKSNGQNDESGGRPSGSKSLKNSVSLSYVPRDSESATVESPKAQGIPASYPSEADSTTGSLAIQNLFKSWLMLLRMPSANQTEDETLEEPSSTETPDTRSSIQQEERFGIVKAVFSYFIGLDATVKIPLLIFIPWYLAVSFLYGAEVLKELTPLWVLGPLIVALYIKMLKGICALYVFSFKQTVKLIRNLPTYSLVAYSYIFGGKLKKEVGSRLLQPLMDIKNLDYRQVTRRKVKDLEGFLVDKYLDFVESIWPYYCRAIRFLKRANLI